MNKPDDPRENAAMLQQVELKLVFWKALKTTVYLIKHVTIQRNKDSSVTGTMVRKATDLQSVFPL